MHASRNILRQTLFLPFLLFLHIKTCQSFHLPSKWSRSSFTKVRNQLDPELGALIPIRIRTKVQHSSTYGGGTHLFSTRTGNCQRPSISLFASDKPIEKEERESDDKDQGHNDVNMKPQLLQEDMNIQIAEEEDRFAYAQNEYDDNSSKSGASSNILQSQRRKMDLSWCGRDNCLEEGLRENVVGKDNNIIFNHPATGQVAYRWHDDDDREVTNEDEHISKKKISVPRVLMLVKRNDDKLLQVAADAVRELTSKGDIMIMLPPEVAAKFKHYYSVDNDKIQLFDPKPIPGFGGNHLPSNNYQYHPEVETDVNVVGDPPDAPDSPPDLVCTLGGDGLLMHASSLFAGPCPPILCIAGGSLGFLTPFSRYEMVDAIRISLGLEEEHMIDNINGNDKAWLENPEVPKLPYVGKSVRAVGDRTSMEISPKIKFGANNQICLSMRMRLECRVINREGITRARFNVLNEVVIDRGSSPYLAALECFCDDVHLTTVQADGVIFSTFAYPTEKYVSHFLQKHAHSPTGSTAYSMAAGGSVVHPAVPAILVTPICPHVLSFRSMVFPDHVILRCYVPDDARSDAAVAFDGKHRRDLHRGDSVQIQMSAYPVPTINRADHSSDWLTSLKRNFNFNTRARQNPL